MFRGRRGRVIALGCVAAAGALAYRSGAIHKAAEQCKKTAALLRLYLQAMQTGGEITASVLRDLQAFLASEEDEIPPSLRQLAKLVASAEASRCVATAVEGTLRGAAAATGSDPRGSRKLHDSPSSSSFSGADSPRTPGIADRFLELLFSERGHSLVTVAISMAAKSTVEAATQIMEAHGGAKGPPPDGVSPREAAQQQMQDLMSVATQGALSFLTDPNGHKALSSLIATFVSVSVGTYVDKTKGINFYEDLMASVATPGNRRAVEAISSTVTREAIEAFFAFSRSPPSGEGPTQAQGKAERCESAPLLPISRVLNYEEGKEEGGRKEGKEEEEGGRNEDGSGRIPPLTSAAALRRISATGIRPPPPTPLHGAAAGGPSEADRHKQQRQQTASSAGVVGEVLSQVVQAVSNAEGRRLVCDVAGSVTAEAVRTTVSSLMEAAGFSGRAPRGRAAAAARARAAKGAVNGARIHEGEQGEEEEDAMELIGGAGELVEVDASGVASPGLYLAIFACLAVQVLLLVQQYGAFAASGV